MLATFSLFSACVRQTGSSGNATTHIAGRTRQAAPPARVACLLGLALLGGTASAGDSAAEMDYPRLNPCSLNYERSLQSAAQKARAEGADQFASVLTRAVIECRRVRLKGRRLNSETR